MSNIYGYVRVSTADQNVERQLLAMRAKGIPEKNIIVEKASGKDFKNRPRYRSLSRRLKTGDTLYIHSLDRLGRSYAEVPVEWNRLSRKKGVTIKVLDMELLDTDRPLSRIEAFLMQIVLMLMSFLAEDERLRIRKRQAEGIAAAKARGVKLGRPSKLLPPNFAEVCALWCDRQISGTEGARRCGMPPSTFYRKAHIWRDAREASHQSEVDAVHPSQSPASAIPATPDTVPHSLPPKTPFSLRSSDTHGTSEPSSQSSPSQRNENVRQAAVDSYCAATSNTSISRLTSQKVHFIRRSNEIDNCSGKA